MWRQGICRGALLVTLVPGLAATVLGTGAEWATTDPERAGLPPARVECRTPQALRLHRFEDRSAQLLCGRRVIVRISVPN